MHFSKRLGNSKRNKRVASRPPFVYFGCVEFGASKHPKVRPYIHLGMALLPFMAQSVACGVRSEIVHTTEAARLPYSPSTSRDFDGQKA